MKSATFLSVRVDPELRKAAEDVLLEGETLASFVERSIRESSEHRRSQSEFIARGIASSEAAKRSGSYVSSVDVLARVGMRLDSLRASNKKSR